MTPEQRAAFARLADELLPATGDLPAPSTPRRSSRSGSTGRSRRGPTWRPPWRGRWRRARRARALHDDDPAAFFALGLMATGAYYLHPRVRRLIGYPGQKPDPAADDESDYWLRDGLLDPVIDARADLAPGVTATRETFAGMGGVEKALWYFAVAALDRRRSRTASGGSC